MEDRVTGYVLLPLSHQAVSLSSHEKRKRLPTDLHGLARIEDGEIGLSVMGYAFLPLSHPAISLFSPEEEERGSR